MTGELDCCGNLKYAPLSTQFGILFSREIQWFYLRSGRLLLSNLIFLILAAVLLGLFFLQCGPRYRDVASKGVDPYSIAVTLRTYYGGVCFIILTALVVQSQSLNVRDTFSMKVFQTERDLRLYTLFPYLVVKNVVEMPLIIVRSGIFLVITYYMMGMQGRFMEWWAVLVLLSFCMNCTTWLVVSSARDPRSALLLLLVSLIPQLLLTGLIVNIHQIPEAVSWLRYVSFFTYGVTLAYLVETEGSSDPNLQLLTHLNGMATYHKYIYVGVLLLFSFTLLLLSARQLKRCSSLT